MFYKTLTPFFCIVALMAAANTSEKLPIEKIQALKRSSATKCNLFHVWATWCPTCIQEMPEFLNQIRSYRHVNPILIDVSSQFQQKHFSIKWMKSQKPGFKTYTKPAGDDAKYMESINKKWDGGLPFTELHFRTSKGWESKYWIGETPMDRLSRAIAAHCK